MCWLKRSTLFFASPLLVASHYFAAVEKSGIRSRFPIRLTANSKSRLRARSASRATVLELVLADSRRNLNQYVSPRL
jgi:hypothetical protein